MGNPTTTFKDRADHFWHSMLATPANPVMGLKGPSPLMELETFKMITRFIPKYQHGGYQGVTKQVTSLWLNSKHHKEDWYLGCKVSDIEQELLAIVEVTRATRSVENSRKYLSGGHIFCFMHCLF